MADDKDKTRGLNLRDIPGLSAMLAVDRWCIWYWRVLIRKDGTRGRTKVPVIPGTGIGVRVNDLEGMAGYDRAASAVEVEDAAGVGWRMEGDIGLVALDLDHCRDPKTGRVDGWALALLTAAPGAYREITPSGTGLRVLGRLGGLPEAFQGKLRVKAWADGLEGPDSAEERAWWGKGIKAGAAIEIFHACARFLTVTGWDPVGDCTVEITPVVEWLMERAEKGRTIEGRAERSEDEGLSLRGHIEDVIAALGVIPNEDVGWDDWSKTGMAVWGATGGSEDGYEAFREWSAKSGKHDDAACRERWDHWMRSPPGRLGIGTLLYEANKADPAWVKPSRKARGESEASVIQGGGKKKKPVAAGSIVTEGKVADIFTAAHVEQLRFDHTRGKWFLWNGARWKREETKLAYRWAHEKARRAAWGHAPKTVEQAGKASFAGGVERLAQARGAFAVTHEIWDADPWLLGTPDGVIDLRTGVMRGARPEDYITRSTAVAPAVGEDCPLWLKFLEEATGGDAGMIGFLQRWFGYCLTGITHEHALVFIHGDGGNGKSVVMNTVFGIMGGYATNAAMDTFVVTRGDKHTTDLAMLDGARMVMASEVEEGQTWAEARIKAITGGDSITARFMRQDNFTFVPRFKLTISGNHKPALKGVDNSTRRRFNIVPFDKRPAMPDVELPEKLKAEWPGILRWMVNGCLEWRRNGLGAPEAVTIATNDYFESQDVFGRWIEDRCNLGWGMDDTPAALLSSFEDWCRVNREEMTDSRRLRGMLEKIQGVHYKKTNGLRLVHGIELKETTVAKEKKAKEEAAKKAAAGNGGAPKADPEEEAPGEF
jgi:putative DNA primase/helicase